ncbi:hypothetical protein HanPSC8_Chr09g0398451 [Helianthus annuus]|nr:hypothetical protein HanPSC8_Chr09g0398451 [Helianthus annuus]
MCLTRRVTDYGGCGGEGMAVEVAVDGVVYYSPKLQLQEAFPLPCQETCWFTSIAPPEFKLAWLLSRKFCFRTVSVMGCWLFGL